MNYLKARDLSLLVAQIEENLLEISEFKDILYYKNVNVFDACYTEIYRAIKEKLFLKNLPNKNSKIENTKIVKKNKILRKVYQTIVSKYYRVQHNCVIKNENKKNRLLIIRTPKNKMGLDVIEELKEKHGWEIYFASWSKQRLKEIEKFNYVNINLNFIELSDSKISKTYHNSRLFIELNKIDFNQITKEIDNVFNSKVGDFVKEVLIYFFSEACFLIDTYENLYKKVKPNLLILLNENIMSERTASLFSNTINLKSVLIQHGIYMGYTFRNFTTDYALVWGSNSKEFLIKRGYHSDKVFKVGYPSNSIDVKSNKNEAYSNVDKVLFLGQNADNFHLMEDDYQQILVILKNAIKSFPKMDFIIRPHPSQSKSYYNELAKERYHNLKIDNKKPLNQNLIEAKIIITVFSTAAVEAMRYGIPIITLDTDVNNSFSPFLNFSNKANDLKSLLKCLDMLSNDAEERKKSIKKSKKFYKNYIDLDIVSSVSHSANIINKVME